MKTNLELQKDVQDELRWEPMLNSSEIGVAAKDGVITLSGTVDTYTKKRIAEEAAKRVSGVQAVALDINVKLSNSSVRTDTDIARIALDALKWNTAVPHDSLKLRVENGWIYLEGTVDWQFQKDAARSCVEDLTGVRGVSNLIALKPHVSSLVIKDNIKKAFHRNASVDSNNIIVETFKNKVTLKGTVHSWFEKKEAEKAAWAAPGVVDVEDELVIKS